MANNHANDEIVIGVDKPASKTKISADLQKILSQINNLEAKISHGKLEGSAVKELQEKLASLKVSVQVAAVDVNQAQASQTGQTIGEIIGQKLKDHMKQQLESGIKNIGITYKCMESNYC